MSSTLRHTLRAVREARGLTQEELARRAGISRQSYWAIESGESVPSTDVALRLARSLGRRVDDLFRLSDDDPGTVEAAPAVAGLSPGTRVRLVRVGGRRLAVPASGGPASTTWTPANGVIRDGAGERVTVSIFPDPPPSPDLVLRGCDPAGQLLADRLRREREIEVLQVYSGSRAALEALARGEAHVAGVHLQDPETGRFNDPWIRRLVPFPCLRIRFAVWEAGLMLRNETRERVGGVEDLPGAGLRLLNREEGSGSRALLDRRLREAGIDGERVPGYAETAASGHLAVAEGVASGAADLGVGIRSAALARGLKSIVLGEEPYDLVIPEHFLDLPAVGNLLDELGRPGLRRQVDALGGYDTSAMGEPR